MLIVGVPKMTEESNQTVANDPHFANLQEHLAKAVSATDQAATMKLSEIKATGMEMVENKENLPVFDEDLVDNNTQKGLKYDDGKARLLYNYSEGLNYYVSYLELSDGEKEYLTFRNQLETVLNVLDQNTTDDAMVNEAARSLIVSIMKSLQTKMTLTFSGLEELVSQICVYGMQKYSYKNYLLGIKFDRLLNAANRHLRAILVRNEVTDSESKLPHIGHVFSNLLMLLELIQYGRHK